MNKDRKFFGLFILCVEMDVNMGLHGSGLCFFRDLISEEMGIFFIINVSKGEKYSHKRLKKLSKGKSKFIIKFTNKNNFNNINKPLSFQGNILIKMRKINKFYRKLHTWV